MAIRLWHRRILVQKLHMAMKTAIFSTISLKTATTTTTIRSFVSKNTFYFLPQIDACPLALRPFQFANGGGVIVVVVVVVINAARLSFLSFCVWIIAFNVFIACVWLCINTYICTSTFSLCFLRNYLFVNSLIHW